MVEKLKVVGLLLLGAGVFLMGVQGFLPAARAQQDGDGPRVAGRCEVVQLALTDVDTATRYTQWVNGQLDQGRTHFMALPGVYPVVCAW